MRVTKNLNKVVRGANALSVGISIVVAILIGIGLGVWFKNLTGSNFALIFWVLIGIAAAFLNIYRAYKDLNADLTELENDPRYKNYKAKNFDDDDEWGENGNENSQNSDENLQNSSENSPNGNKNFENNENLQDDINLVNSTPNSQNSENSQSGNIFNSVKDGIKNLDN